MDEDERLMEELMNAPIKFGLEAQGHVPTIQSMLAEGKSWDQIGDAIGWCGKTAEQHYRSWEQRQPASSGIGEMRVVDQSDRTKVLAVLSRDPEFSIFDATERQAIALTLDRLKSDELIDYPEPKPGYPWMRARVTEKGLEILKSANSPPTKGRT